MITDRARHELARVSRDPALREQPEWAVRDPETAEPVPAGRVVRQESTAIDVTGPGAANQLRSVMEAIREWGIDYVKADFLDAGACERRRHAGSAGWRPAGEGCA
jgi:hypothetical protein